MILLTIFAIVVLINICFYLFFSKFALNEEPESSIGNDFPVSVIVCAKNESENLLQYIPHLLDQDYPDYELILVNDNSSDDSLEIMEEYAKDDTRIKVVDVVPNEAFWGSKKYALTLGIKKASHKRLLFTDADCRPVSNQWIREMTSKLTNEKQVVIGYGAYEKGPSFLNRLIRFETVITAIQYFSFAQRGVPYMGVGRNLAYTSNLFFENNGFMSHMDLQSGDDDLFINEAATRQNVEIQCSRNSFTVSKPKDNWKEWITQKKASLFYVIQV